MFMLEKLGSGVEHGHLGEFLIFLAGIDSGGYCPVNHEDQPDQCKTQTVRSHVEADPPFMLHFTFCFKKVGKNEVEGIT